MTEPETAQREQALQLQRKLEQFGQLLRRSHPDDEAPDGDCLTRTEGMALMVLDHCAPGRSVTPTQLARMMDVSLSAVTHKLNALEREGYVRRAVSPEDRREVLIALSERGSAFVRDMQAHYADRLRALIEFLGDGDTGQFLRLLDRIFEFVRISHSPPRGG